MLYGTIIRELGRDLEKKMNFDSSKTAKGRKLSLYLKTLLGTLDFSEKSQRNRIIPYMGDRQFLTLKIGSKPFSHEGIELGGWVELDFCLSCGILEVVCLDRVDASTSCQAINGNMLGNSKNGKKFQKNPRYLGPLLEGNLANWEGIKMDKVRKSWQGASRKISKKRKKRCSRKVGLIKKKKKKKKNS